MSTTVTTECVSQMEFPHPDDEEPYEASNDPDDKEAESDEAAVLARLRREAKAREIGNEIQHGKTTSKKTIATQIRILEEQMEQLKDISHLTGQNVSAILREIIADYILRMRTDEYIARHLDSQAAGRSAWRKLQEGLGHKLLKDE